MNANAGAVWPVIAHKRTWDTMDPRTIIHEEAHLKTQVVLLVIPWLVLYVLFFLIKFPDGYRNNPFEIQAYEVGGGREKFTLFGWFKYIWKKNPTR